MSIKKFFVAVAATALVVAFAASSASAAYTHTVTLKQGSRGAQVSSLQATLSVTPATGYFGSITKAAVKSFQAGHGLTADGVVGPMTGAALAAWTGSPVLGATCPNGMTLASNCMTAPGATPSVSLCPNGMTLASNCMTGPTGGNVSNAPLSINNVSAVSGYLNTAVGVGTVDNAVANIRLVTGAGGAGNLTGINVSFYNRTSATDYQFSKYASDVSVWLNGVKVGSLPVSSFSQYNSVYSAFLPVSGAVLNANSTNDIKIAVSSLPVIDTANMNGDIWVLDITSLRYSDSTGTFNYTPSNVFANSAYMTGSGAVPLSTAWFSFSTAASAQSIKLTVTRNVSDSTDRVVTGSSSANTNGVTLAMIDLNAQGSAISVRRLPVTLTVGGAATLPSNVINTLRLYDAAGNQLDSQSVTTAVGNPQTVTFQNLNVTVPMNGTVTLTVKGDFNTVGGTGFAAGDYAQVSLPTPTDIQAYDSGNNVLSGSTYLTGSSTGVLVYMYVNGISVAAGPGSPTTSVAAAGGAQTHSTVTYVIPFSVTAFGSVAYIPSTAAAVLATTTTATNAIQFCVDATTACAAAGSGIVAYTGSDTLSASANGTFQIPIGQTKTFQLVITYQPASAISTRASLLNVNWSPADSTSGGQWYKYTAGLNSNSFKTPYAAAQ